MNCPIKADDLLEDVRERRAGNRDQICSKTRAYLAQRIFLPQRARGIYGHHLKNFFSRNAWELLLKRAHLGKQDETLVARKTVGTETNVESQRAQALECKWGVVKVVVTSRAVDDVKFWVRSFKQIEVAVGQFI